MAHRRKFRAEDKKGILEEADRPTGQGAVGALLRREYLFVRAGKLACPMVQHCTSKTTRRSRRCWRKSGIKKMWNRELEIYKIGGKSSIVELVAMERTILRGVRATQRMVAIHRRILHPLRTLVWRRPLDLDPIELRRAPQADNHPRILR